MVALAQMGGMVPSLQVTEGPGCTSLPPGTSSKPQQYPLASVQTRRPSESLPGPGARVLCQDSSTPLPHLHFQWV